MPGGNSSAGRPPKKSEPRSVQPGAPELCKCAASLRPSCKAGSRRESHRMPPEPRLEPLLAQLCSTRATPSISQPPRACGFPGPDTHSPRPDSGARRWERSVPGVLLAGQKPKQREGREDPPQPRRLVQCLTSSCKETDSISTNKREDAFLKDEFLLKRSI